MYWYRNKNDGKERLWVDEDEFDTLTEYELRTAGLYPTMEQPAVDIERFIQRHMKAGLDQHADLGDGIGGAIEFGPARIKIFISRRLTEMADEVDCPPGVRGRWRATMAHEATHGLLHRRVYETSPAQTSLFETTEEEEQGLTQTIKCSDSDIGFDLGAYDWREYQANRGMAAFLMPRQVFLEVAKAEISRLAFHGQPIWPGTGAHSALVRRLSVNFEVSQRAASIRLKALEGAVGIGQDLLVASA